MTLISNFRRLFVSGTHVNCNDKIINTREAPKDDGNSFLSSPPVAFECSPTGTLSDRSDPAQDSNISTAPTSPKVTSDIDTAPVAATTTFKANSSTSCDTSTKSAHIPQNTTTFTLNASLEELYPDLPSKYTLVSVLGEGAFSTVYKAIDHHNQDATVAIKVINKSNLTAKQLGNIKNEIHIMKRSGSHPNILKLLNYVDTEDHCFLILEYCNGGEIFNKIIEYTYFSEDLSRHVFKQLLSAIEHLHDHNIVHRDIKPENLLFCQIPYFPRPASEFSKVLRKSDDASKIDEGIMKPNIGGGTIGVIKLADFGLAKQLPNKSAASSSSNFYNSHHSNLKTPCGTAGYTAPEVITCNTQDNVNSYSRKKTFSNQMSKKNYYSKAVDIWSLGCFLYTILCGFPPFYDDDQNQLTMKILRGDFEYLKPWWDEISSDAKDLISQMINIDPETRISVDEIWQHPWVVGSSAKEDLAQNYFGNDTVNTYHKYEVRESDVFSKQQDVEHIEYAPESSGHTPISDEVPSFTPKLSMTAHLHPQSINSTDNTFFGTFGNKNSPLMSPRAEAIKRVFDNPAMTGSRVASSVSGVVSDIDATGELVSSGEEFTSKRGSSVVQFLANVEDRERLMNGNKEEEDEEIDSSDSFSNSSDELFIAPKRSQTPQRSKKKLPRTPNPTKSQLSKLNFKDVFKIDSSLLNDDEDDDEETDEDGEVEQADEDDAEKKDTITRLVSSSSRRKNSSKLKIGTDPLSKYDEDADSSSNNSLSEEDAEGYQTRSSSIISGINGDFKFTLNLNDSNLLSRRRSSTLSKGPKKSNSVSSPTSQNMASQNILTTFTSAG